MNDRQIKEEIERADSVHLGDVQLATLTFGIAFTVFICVEVEDNLAGDPDGQVERVERKRKAELGAGVQSEDLVAAPSAQPDWIR